MFASPLSQFGERLFLVSIKLASNPNLNVNIYLACLPLSEKLNNVFRGGEENYIANILWKQ